jgi:hypothetical protein
VEAGSAGGLRGGGRERGTTAGGSDVLEGCRDLGMSVSWRTELRHGGRTWLKLSVKKRFYGIG